MESKLSPELSRWCSELLPRVKTISPELHRLYSERGNLSHYLALASLFEVRFQDTILAQSAFLHGVPTAGLPQLPSGFVDEEVFVVLKERERLRALNVQDQDAHEQLLANVLSFLSRARTIVLFILEQLHHLDPDGRLGRWSLRFHHCPSPLPRDLPAGPQFKAVPEKESLGAFSRNVVAPTAKFFGLWRERNIVEDAALFHFRRGRFDDLLDFARKASMPGGECEVLANLVRKQITNLMQEDRVHNVRWEWHHIGSLDRRIPRQIPRPGIESRRLLYRLGFVSIICPTREDCYQVLHTLHSRFSHRPTELRDSIGQSTIAGYRAIHTILALSGSQDAPDAIAVRILPRSADRTKWRSADPLKLKAIEKRFRSEGGLGLGVFTPDGRSVQVPVGATVLDFAYALNNRWVAFLSGATVNREPVDVLQRLSPNDVVWLRLASDPQPLPPDWDQRVPPSSVKKIRQHLRKHYRPLLMAEGRRWLREQLMGRDLRVLPEDDQLDTFVEEAAERLRSEIKSARISQDRKSWLLQQMGLLAVVAQGRSLPFPLEIRSTVLEDIVEATANLIENATFITLNELNLPEDFKYRLKGVSLCDSCKPSRREQWAGTETQGNILVLHRIGAKCTHGGIPVSRLRLLAAPRYLVIETTNRVGAGADVLSVFQRCRVNLVELAGRQIGPAWGVIRVQFDYVSRKTLEGLIQALSQVWGVTRIVGPSDGTSAAEVYLPPRSTTQSLSLPPPYVCGNNITDDAYFYGMGGEQGYLRQTFIDVVRPETRTSKFIFVYGPKRVGKTSLVQYFIRALDRTSYNCLTAYYEAPEGTSWSAAEKDISQELLQRATFLAKRSGLELPHPPGDSLAETIQMVRQKLDCSIVLAIDEAVGLFETSSQCGEEEAIRRFRARTQNIPGLLVLWIGPEAPVRQLPNDLQHILQRSDPLLVESLTQTEVLSLLRAEKLAPKYQILVSSTLSKVVHRLTAGNPYWVQNLGKAMWSMARRAPTGVIEYDASILDKAKETIFEFGVPFSDRLDRGLAQHVLTALSRQDNESGMQRVALQAMLADHGVTTEQDDIQRTLEDLKARGSVVNSRLCWKIASPILAEYIRHIGLR